MRPLPLFAALPLAACGGIADGSSPAGPSTSRQYPLSGFERIVSHAPADIRVTTGDRFDVRAEGSEKLIQRLRLTVEGDTLRIGTDSGNWNARDGSLRIAVTMPGIRGATIAGAGDVIIDRGAENFAGSISGAGDLTIGELRGGHARLSVSGAGNIAAAGMVERADLSVSGTGSIGAADLRARSARIEVGGAGDVKAMVNGDADVSVSGVGSVDVAGQARCNVRKSGVGSVKCGGSRL